MPTLKTVVLDSEKCIGCITCMRRCPTEAIRIENGKAKILYDKCINCGECVRSCKGGAKRPVYDSFDLVSSYAYKIALPSPSLFGQFNNLDDPNYVIEGLLALGFDEVFEVGLAAELVTDCTKKLMQKKNLPRPVISTACPAVAELILLKFHELADHMLNVYAPAKIAAKLAKKQALEKGIPADDIGIFFISPCPAKVYSLHKEEVANEKYISGVLSQSDVYFRLVDKMNKIKNPRKLGKCGYSGLGWGSSGGESNSLGLGNYIHCSGVRNVLGEYVSRRVRGRRSERGKPVHCAQPYAPARRKTQNTARDDAGLRAGRKFLYLGQGARTFNFLPAGYRPLCGDAKIDACRGVSEKTARHRLRRMRRAYLPHACGRRRDERKTA